MANTMDKLAKELKSQMNASDARKPKPYDAQAEVLRVEDGVAWVHIPGGVEETPVRLTINAKKGDMVNIRVANGSAWITGNGTNPPTDDSTANYAVNISNEVKKDVTILNTVVAEEIEATNARFGNVEADTAKIHNLTANQINATVGYIDDLTADNITANDISAASGYIKDLTADNITANDISADHAAIGSLDTNYAKINAANVTDLSAQNAWVNKIMVQTGLIASREDVFYLNAIQIDAANITAGTIDVEHLIVTVDGQKYLIHVNPSTGQPTYEKLDGNIVEPRTITADKIVAHDITVQEITTENLVGTNGWINLNQGKFFYTTNGSTWANTTNGIMWDGTSLKIKGDVNITAGNVYTKTQTDTALGGKVGNNEVITKINASSEGVQIQASKVDIAGAAVFNNYSTTTQMNTAIGNAVDGIEVGSRNMLLETDAPKTFTITLNSSNYTAISCYKTYAPIPSIFSVDDLVTISFDWSTTATDGNFRIECGDVTPWTWGTVINAIGTRSSTSQFADITSSNTSGHIIVTFKITSSQTSAASELQWLRIRVDGANTNGKTFTVYNAKAERGNKATDWTPAPEDIQAEIDAKKSVHTLDTSYSYTYANILTYSAEGYGGTAGANWTVSNTSGVKVGDTARLKVTVSDMSNAPVYVVGTVTAVTSGTVLKMTSHGLDTTIIDGGNILTNSIGASQIAANAITAEKLDATTINASNKLTVGSMTSAAQDSILNSKVTVGGENLCQQFLSYNNPTTYNAYRIPLTENLIAGETYTLQLWGVTFDNTPAGGTVAAYWGGGSSALTGSLTPDANGYVVKTFTVTQAMADRTPDGKRWYINLYNSVPSGEKTARNMTLTRWKLEKGNKATAWSLSSVDTKGNDNLLRCTADMNVGSGGWTGGHFRYSGGSGGAVSHVTAASPVPAGVRGAIRVTNSGSSALRIGFCQDSLSNLTTNKLYTLSGWVKASASGLAIDFQPIWAAADKTTGAKQVGMTDKDGWCYFSTTLRLTGAQNSTYSAAYVYVNDVPANGWFEVCGLKLEEGAIATGWTTGMESDAENFISMDSSGIRIASANPATQNQRIALTNSQITFIKQGSLGVQRYWSLYV